MKRRPVVYGPAAQRDLLEAAAYIRRDSPASAAEWLERLDHTLDRLGSFPKSGVVPKDRRLAAKGYRVLVAGEFLVFYLIGPKSIEVRRVLHGKRRHSFLF